MCVDGYYLNAYCIMQLLHNIFYSTYDHDYLHSEETNKYSRSSNKCALIWYLKAENKMTSPETKDMKVLIIGAGRCIVSIHMDDEIDSSSQAQLGF